ncbi:hypothetical protein [Burkholderia ambifaria]|jgi:hypothetical protein|uniref:Transmembrane protein n=2 Tax=Burkholderia ambifaria TaxID=152480 RepID=A0AA41JN89_9BURK|nr:hypothetical protein [Burkholderia ambifaria]ACB62529.1 hypothetical protein BamMC406_0027 [Burkholderia ambifaria MC40-6]MBR8133405.1 hypothetical protein [Burkholderia ambifaria]PRE01788.1 hypothetical protein C6P77_09895 [Burkholderia ambifaria]UEP48224.1 hypothetical protein LMA00_00175 [Burkholderia ambifaria]
MKAFYRIGTLLVWLMCATVTYGLIWSRHLDLFPSWPGWMARLAYHITQLNPADTGTMEELTFTYMALVSFINVSLLTLIGWLVWRSSRRLAIGFRKPR